MKPVEKILLNKKEERLLKRIEKNGMWMEDKESSSKEISTLISYGMLSSYIDKRFPIKLVERTEIPEDNAYKAAHDVEDYWRYVREKRRNQHRESRRYWVTTLIAVLALVLAGISLAAQLGLIQLPAA